MRAFSLTRSSTLTSILSLRERRTTKSPVRVRRFTRIMLG
jgi:hypothetical protein